MGSPFLIPGVDLCRVCLFKVSIPISRGSSLKMFAAIVMANCLRNLPEQSIPHVCLRLRSPQQLFQPSVLI